MVRAVVVEGEVEAGVVREDKVEDMRVRSSWISARVRLVGVLFD